MRPAPAGLPHDSGLKQVCTNTHSYLIKAHPHTPRPSAGHLANIASATPTMSAFVDLGRLTLTSDSKHAGVETITMAMARTPCQDQGPAGPSCPALSTPVCFTKGPRRSGLPGCPSGADLRGVLGSWSNKKSLERKLEGRGYGV